MTKKTTPSLYAHSGEISPSFEQDAFSKCQAAVNKIAEEIFSNDAEALREVLANTQDILRNIDPILVNENRSTSWIMNLYYLFKQYFYSDISNECENLLRELKKYVDFINESYRDIAPAPSESDDEEQEFFDAEEGPDHLWEKSSTSRGSSSPALSDVLDDFEEVESMPTADTKWASLEEVFGESEFSEASRGVVTKLFPPIHLITGSTDQYGGKTVTLELKSETPQTVSVSGGIGFFASKVCDLTFQKRIEFQLVGQVILITNGSIKIDEQEIIQIAEIDQSISITYGADTIVTKEIPLKLASFIQTKLQEK